MLVWYRCANIWQLRGKLAWMQFYRELAVRFFNVEFAGIRFDLEGIVVYPVYHHAGDMCWMCSVWQNVLVGKVAVVVEWTYKKLADPR